MVAHRGVCVVAPRGHAWLPGGHTWLLLGGMHGCSGGACVVAPRGVACVVAQGGACVVFFDEIQSMSRQYASYWNAFLWEIYSNLCKTCNIM